MTSTRPASAVAARAPGRYVHVYACPGALVWVPVVAVTWTVVADEVVQVSGACWAGAAGEAEPTGVSMRVAARLHE
jgi:hypothetical protein